MKVIQEGGEGLTEDRLKSTFEKLRPEIRYEGHEKVQSEIYVYLHQPANYSRFVQNEHLEKTGRSARSGPGSAARPSRTSRTSSRSESTATSGRLARTRAWRTATRTRAPPGVMSYSAARHRSSFISIPQF